MLPVEKGSILGSVGTVCLWKVTKQGVVVCTGCWSGSEKATIPCERHPRTGKSVWGSLAGTSLGEAWGDDHRVKRSHDSFPAPHAKLLFWHFRLTLLQNTSFYNAMEPCSLQHVSYCCLGLGAGLLQQHTRDKIQIQSYNCLLGEIHPLCSGWNMLLPILAAYYHLFH